MKILHVTESFARVGGVESYVLDLLGLLRAWGHDNAVIYRRAHGRSTQDCGERVYHVPKDGRARLERARVLDIVLQEEPTVIYLHAVHDPDLVMELAGVAPTVAYVHGFYPVCAGLGKYFRRSDRICTRPLGLQCAAMIYLRRCASARDPRSVVRVMRMAERRRDAYQSLGQIIVASAYMKDLLVQNGFDDSKVVVLPYFVKLPDVSRVTAPDLEKPCILFAGRLEIEKGLQYLIRALPYISEQCDLMVAGSGSTMARCRALAEEMEVRGRVRFLGWLSERELQMWYRRCVMTVMPTVMPEPFGKVGVEAMANCRPVVAFDVGGIGEWLKDGVSGFLVPPLNVRLLAARIGELLEDAGGAARAGSRGRGHVENTYSARRHVERLLRVFESATSYGGYGVCERYHSDV